MLSMEVRRKYAERGHAYSNAQVTAYNDRVGYKPKDAGKHRRTQDFTMDGVHVAGAEPGGRKSPSGSRGKAPVRVAEAKCEISVQLLTFSCIKFRL